MFDYGTPEANMEKYGQESPPFYNFDNLKDHKIAMFVGDSDLLAVPEDYNRLRDKLKELGCLIYFKETVHGHLGILSPVKE
jgi:hypothetical protein